MYVVVLTVDQDGSRRATDQVPTALAALATVPARLAFERTVGDELQGLLDEERLARPLLGGVGAEDALRRP